jgi:hypothetical protein
VFLFIQPQLNINLIKQEKTTMQKFLFTTVLLFFTAVYFYGCTAATLTITGPPVPDPELYDMVPPENKKGVRKAEYRFLIAEERLELAELKSRLADNRNKYAELRAERALKYKEMMAAKLDIKRFEAIERSALGDPEANVAAIADLKIYIIRLEEDRTRLKTEMQVRRNRIDDLVRRVKTQERRLKKM